MGDGDSIEFISVGFRDGDDPVTISLEQMQKFCRDGRVQDLIDDLLILCRDVVTGWEQAKVRAAPTNVTHLDVRPVPGEELTKEVIEAEFPAWEVFPGLDGRWHARVRGATPPVMVHDDHLEGLREEILRKIAKADDYWHAQAQSSSHT